MQECNIILQKQFFARVGIASENESPYAGAGISWNNLRLDISASYHPQLGISPGLMLIVNFKRKRLKKVIIIKSFYLVYLCFYSSCNLIAFAQESNS